MIVAPGSTSISIDVFFADDNGLALTGKIAADFPVCKWSSGTNTSDTTITLSDLAVITTAHPNNNTAGGIKEREGGWYRLDLPNNMFTSSGRKILTFAETTNKRILAPFIDVQNPTTILADIAHGGSSATLRLGSSSATPALLITNSAGNAVALTSTGGGGSGIAITGQGAGYGMSLQGGTSGGHGLFAVGGTGGGAGIALNGVDAAGLKIQSFGSNVPAILLTGSTSGGDGIDIVTTGGHGISIIAAGISKHGILVTGGSAGVSDGINVVAGFGGVSIRGDIEGTITNLTNAPTIGDFTAAMKLSLNAATPTVTVSDKTGFKLSSDGIALITAWTVAITGNIIGNLFGSVGLVTGNIGGIAGTTQTLDALQTALNSAHGAGSWLTGSGTSTLTTADIDTRLAAYGIPTLTQLLSRTLLSAEYALSSNQVIINNNILAVPGIITADHGVGSYVSIGTAPTVAAIADAVWDELGIGHTVIGSYGQLVNAIYSRVNSSRITVTSIIDAIGNIHLTSGDSYYASENRILEWEGEVSDQFPDLTGADIFLNISDGLLIVEGEPVIPTGIQKVGVEITELQSSTLDGGVYNYDVRAILANNHKITIARGKCYVTDSEES